MCDADIYFWRQLNEITHLFDKIGDSIETKKVSSIQYLEKNVTKEKSLLENYSESKEDHQSLQCKDQCKDDSDDLNNCLVLIADLFHSISVGFVLAFPSVLNPDILSPNATDISATKDQASWITSIYGISGAFGFIIIPMIMQIYGRKPAQVALNVFVLIGFIMLSLAENVSTLYAARTIQGLSLCGVYVNSIILSEYAHPNRRGYFITLQKGLISLGSLFCHALIIVCTWRQIAAIASIANVVTILLTIAWTESPAYLAMKGKYEKCRKSYIYLNGNTITSKKELDDLILAQEERRENKETKCLQTFSNYCKKIVRKDFLKPFFIITLLTLIIESSGRYYNLVYIVQIIKDITGNESVGIYCSIVLDFLTLVSSCISSYVITKLKRRSMLLIFGYFSVALTFLISLTIYLKSINFAANLIWLTLSIILFTCFITNLGIVPVSFTISGEIFPLEYRASGTTATGIVFTLLYAVTMKCTPIMIEKTGIEGMYGMYGLCMAGCLIILHFILLETKDMTLQEIEDKIKGTKRKEIPISLERERLTSNYFQPQINANDSQQLN